MIEVLCDTVYVSEVSTDEVSPARQTTPPWSQRPRLEIRRPARRRHERALSAGALIEGNLSCVVSPSSQAPMSPDSPQLTEESGIGRCATKAGERSPAT